MPACADNYQECDAAASTPCCTVLYGCFQRRGRMYHQCRPHLPGACTDGDDWLCPQRASDPPLATAPTAAPPHELAASRFVSALGPGINIMSSNIRWGQLSWCVPALNKHHICGHVSH